MNDFFQTLRDRLPQDLMPLLFQAAAAVAIVIFALVAYWFVTRSLSLLRGKDRLSEHTFVLLRRIVRWVLFPVVILLVLQQFGLLENVWAALISVLAMVAIGFVAVWSVLSNAFCSLVLMIARPFDIGDTIDIPSDHLRGKVVDFNLMFTTLQDEEGDLIQIPNNLFFQKPIRRRLGKATIALDEQAERQEPAA
jgi:small-conductance mechanosensitive channel